MIFESILYVIRKVAEGIFGWFPDVDSLPFGVDETLSSAFALFHKLAEFFPPFATLYTAFMWYVVAKVGIRVLAMIPVVRHTVSHVHTLR